MPIAWLSGLKMDNVTSDTASVFIKFRFLNQNPFKSMYFACQAMAAEMTTGLLAMGHIENHSENISMLVLDFQASFSKKAVGKVKFICSDGTIAQKAIQKAIETKLGVSCPMESKAYDSSGDCVSTYQIIWSFKVKT
jgi:hypothetical protein